MKKLFAIFFTLFLAACAPVATPAIPPTTTQAPIPSTTPPPSTPIATRTTIPIPTPTPSLVTLRFWHAQPYAHHTALAALIAQFNAAHSDIRLTEAYQGDSTDLMQRTRGAISAPNPPNILLAYPDELAGLIQQNALVPLDTLATNDIFPAFVDRYPQFSNQVYSIAFARHLQVMYYNADLLKLAGASRPPETWDEFTRICDALAKIPDMTCYALNPSAATFTTWVWNRGGEVMSADGKTSTITQPAGADALNLLSDLIRKKQTALVGRAFQEPTDFALGKIAFTFDATSGLGVYDRAIKNASKPFAWGIAPSPRTAHEPVILAFGPSLAIVRTNAEHERAARVFVNWMLDRTASSAWAQATGMFPARASAQTALVEYARAHTQYSVALGWLKYARAEPNSTAWSAIRVHLAEAMLAVANGKAAGDALNDAAKKSNAALAGQ